MKRLGIFQENSIFLYLIVYTPNRYTKLLLCIVLAIEHPVRGATIVAVDDDARKLTIGISNHPLIYIT